MTAATDIRRQIAESCAFLQADTKRYQQAVREHDERVRSIREACPHENVSSFSGQYTIEYQCADCGKVVSG
jgi:nitrite reductase/ring-hydroxylating ferredoxin subunit